MGVFELLQLRAALEGSGQAASQTIVFLVGLWGIGIPAAAVSVAGSSGLCGLWSGLLLGHIVAAILAALALVRSDWERLAGDAAGRAELARAHEEDNIMLASNVSQMDIFE